MRITRDGIVVHIPLELSAEHPQVRRFIAKGLDKLGHLIHAGAQPPRACTLDETALRQMVMDWAQRMSLTPGRITLRAMTRKWGSCSSRGNITLNSALLTVEPRLAEYVVVHELAHLRVFDHSPRFWKLVESYMPDYAERKAELDRMIP